MQLPATFRAVSLGANCMAAYETRKHFKFDGAYPFDWWVTPASALLDLIRNDFFGLFDRNALHIVGGGRSVLDINYGLLHHHDFVRNGEDLVDQITDEDLVANRSKLAHIVQRWNGLSAQVLFVRHGWDAGESLIPCHLQPMPDDLCNTLDARFSNLDYRVLLVDVEEPGDDPRLIRSQLADFTYEGERVNPSDLEWRDNSEVWGRLFSACIPNISKWLQL